MKAEWWSVGVAIVAAVVAAWQAWQARQARKDSETARDLAAAHERRALAAAESSAGAAKRSATAHERLAAAAERTAKGHRAWSTRHRGGETWEIVNDTGGAVEAALSPMGDQPFLTIDEDTEEYRLVGPGQGLPVEWAHRLSTPNFARVTVRWVDTDAGEHRTETVTLESSPPPRIYS
jgi:type II secretory pathway pseudopilin PulG